MTELPTTFGKYFLTEKLATGGMAEIYLAKIVGPGGFEKQLVIKQILPKLSGQRHFVDLFVTEAKTLVTLAHGNIVPVYELGVIGDTYFIAMEYIDGPTLYRLTEVLARKEVRMEPNLAAWITARILEGLDYAHRKGEGVIHRDLSPRNVMLSRDGEVKLVDFGIAVTLGEGDAESAQSAPTGSFPYMSPEQVRREPLTGQTDLFSAGVLLWEMLVGHRLFARAEPDATLAAVVDGEIPVPSSKRAEVPAKLDEVAMKALERDTTKRWNNAGEMLAALQKYLYALDETPGPRDLTALVARYCPPETRRLPTHAEAAHDETDSSPRPPTADGTGVRPPTADGTPAGPRTAVIPRSSDGARGKPPRQQSFATHVELKDMLERATPLFPLTAITDEPAPADATEDRGDPTPPIAREPRPGDAAEDRRDPTPAIARDPGPGESQRRNVRARSEGKGIESIRARGRAAPSRSLLILAGLGAIALAIASIVVFFRGRDRVLAGDHRDAAVALHTFPDVTPIDAAIDAPADAAIDAPVDAAIDATIDAAVRHADAHPAAPDAHAATVIDAKPAGRATLKIGAEPWGEIVIDGTAHGRTPQQVEVTAGHHVVEVIFKGVDPPLTQRFNVDVSDGDIKPIQADFPH